ncbi:hypothetical protein BJF87_12075 [Gordonia sp. CNJ-863]|nr:hypothetical protein BJF87_12075 [Gordonia sp. CNJ-863]
MQHLLVRPTIADSLQPIINLARWLESAGDRDDAVESLRSWIEARRGTRVTARSSRVSCAYLGVSRVIRSDE